MLSFDKLTGNGRDIYNYLSESDSLSYLSENERVRGQWFGNGASTLGLSGEVDRDSFNQIKNCNHPQTGEFLRQRESKIKMFDLCASAPKSFSIMARPGGDTRLDEAHKKAVFEMLGDVERHMSCEVQANGLNGTRKTGSLIAAVFFHDTSRMKDPQLHGHAAVANMTYDEAEQRYKAIDARVFYERKSYFLQVYRNALARECLALGYEIEMHSCGKNGRDKSFEIAGVPQEMREKFSKMSGLIAEGVEEFIDSKGKAPTEDQVGHIAHKVRPEKENLPRTKWPLTSNPN
jgi:conjugative relaxase-like TrwC/TraI family protein